MRFLILLTYTLVLFAVLALVLLLARIPLAELVAMRAMQSAGLEQTAVHIRQFDTSSLIIDRLEFSRTSSSATSRVAVRDMRINYRVAQLIDGEVESISIDHLLLHQDSTSTTIAPAQPIDQAELLRVLHTDWQAFVPLKSISIDRIELQGTSFTPFENTVLRLQTHKTATAITTRLEYLGKQLNHRLLIGTLDGDTLAIDLDNVDKPEHPALHASVKTYDGGVNIHWLVLPTELKAWLEPFVDIEDIGAGAAVDGTLNIDLSSFGNIDAKLDAATKYHTVAAYKLLRPSLTLLLRTNTAAPQRRIDILPGSFVRVAGIESEMLAIGNSKLNLNMAYTKPADQWSVDGAATLARLPVSYGDYAFVLKNIQNRVHADVDGISLNTSVSPENLPGKFVVEVSHSTASAAGTASLTMPQPIDLDGAESHLGQLLTSWPFPFDLASGVLQLGGSAAWSDGALHKIQADIRLSDIGGNFNEMLFSGLNYRQQLDLLPSFSTPVPGKLTLEHIDAGVAIDNVSARIGIEPSVYGLLPKLVVNDLFGHLFGGTFSGDPFAYDLNTPANALTIHVHDLDLADIVATQQFNDLEVTGRLDGDFPIEINPYGVFINNGYLRNATPEGVIRYQPSAGTGGVEQNPLTGIALKALSDFHYDTLKARANYVPDGTLTLGFELKGTSPPLQTSRPVHLNINTEQNLLSLLKSIRYVDGLNQGLDKRVRDLYKHQSGN